VTLSDTETLIRLLTAAALGSLVGFERERLLWAAGIRTHMLVCVGACLFMIVSAFGFAQSAGAPNVSLDPSRVAAQVVSGIGFLGAGAILARGEVVRGLTTAASIWTVAAIGLAIGGGLYFAAIASTAIILIILAGVKPLEEMYRARNQTLKVAIEAEHGALTPDILRNALNLSRSRVKRFLVKARKGKKLDDITVVIARVPPREASSYTAKIGKLRGVRGAKKAHSSKSDAA
jgi:putative Mg2+ transporter-C (MgtC) family protein